MENVPSKMFEKGMLNQATAVCEMGQAVVEVVGVAVGEAVVVIVVGEAHVKENGSLREDPEQVVAGK